MQNGLNLSFLYPTLLAMGQTLLFVVLVFALLKWGKLLTSPLEELPINLAIVSGIILLGTIVISSSSFGALCKVFAVYKNTPSSYTSDVTAKFTQFFFITFIFEVIYMSTSWMLSGLLMKKGTALQVAKDGNVSVGVLYACINIGLAFGFYEMCNEICELLSPVSVDFY